ncbi:LytTR family DNA-binding domain-containing protein [Anaerococcus sp. Marseille-Q7828]|uniref:LytTR family DNA-binding domain-containing protein n=1 Tax=Anaerococcus sp. Marseille-Q7828 TaxID=3036300 RepID=UPI0024AD4B02|nr:LytTR family DNA-binding domain-containing protein [Anaerococcus sp. Marseille-Q7828]
MKVEIVVDKNLKEKEVIIKTPKVDQESLDIKEKILSNDIQILSGIYDEKLEIIDLDDIIRIYANDKKVFTVTEKKTYLMKLPLYKIEDYLSGKNFVRISNSEIINLDKTKNFDFKYLGTISCEMDNGDICFVSRRAMKKVREILGV